MKEIASNIISWITELNEKVCKFNQFFQVPPITFRMDSPLNCISLRELRDSYIGYLLNDFKEGLDKSYSMDERIFLPCIKKLIPYIEAIEIDKDKILWLADLERDTTYEYVVLCKITELLCPTINTDKKIQRYGINVFSIEGAGFADVCYALSSVGSLEEFNLWIKGISNPCTMTANFSVNCLDKLECKIPF